MIRLAAIASLLALIACADNRSVIIVRNIEPSDSCMVSPTTDVSVLRGFLDVTPVLPNGQFNSGYVMTPEIRNPTAAPSVTPTRPGNPSGHIFFIQGIDIQVLAGPDAASETAVTALQAAGLANRTIRLGGSIEPSSTAALAFEVIDAQMLDALQGAVTIPAQVVVRIVAFGEMDGSDLESQSFDYPITLCDGCLIFNLGPCAGLPEGVTIPSGGTCGPVQDGALACCQRDSGQTICPAVAITEE